MTLWQIAVAGWLGGSLLFLVALYVHDLWLTHKSHVRARGFLAAERADDLEMIALLPTFDPDA